MRRVDRVRVPKVCVLCVSMQAAEGARLTNASVEPTPAAASSLATPLESNQGGSFQVAPTPASEVALAPFRTLFVDFVSQLCVSSKLPSRHCPAVYKSRTLCKSSLYPYPFGNFEAFAHSICNLAHTQAHERVSTRHFHCSVGFITRLAIRVILVSFTAEVTLCARLERCPVAEDAAANQGERCAANRVGVSMVL